MCLSATSPSKEWAKNCPSLDCVHIEHHQVHQYTASRDYTIECVRSLTIYSIVPQAEKLGVPKSPLTIRDCFEMINSGVRVNWRGQLVVPEGSIDSEGFLVVQGAPEASPAATTARTDEGGGVTRPLLGEVKVT